MIEVKNIHKEYGGFSVVDDLTFSIPQGHIFGFLGANGAGKTTTLKMLTGLLTPTSGEIKIKGGHPADTDTRKLIGFLPETPSFYEYLTGFEFLELCASLSLASTPSDEIKKLCNTTLKEMGLEDAKDRPIRTYSKGMRQRLGFAQAIVHDPEYIFLDEPLDGLDPLGRKSLKDLVKKKKREGKTIFFSSHILFDAEEICDEVGIIHHGKLLYFGPTQEFCNGKPLEERFVEMVEKQA